MFAHFDPRAYKDEFIVFLTRSDFDARQILGEPLGDDGVFLAVMERASIRSLHQHIQPYEEWIAKKMLEWRTALGFS